jgi:DNA polymerase-3 subunit epsilon
VNPKDHFDPISVSIHGIEDCDVRSAPTWTGACPRVASLLSGKVVVSHTAFDRLAVRRACEKNGLSVCECQWLDSARVVRRAWPQYFHSRYGLANVAGDLGIEYVEHDALEDARYAGEVMLRAISISGLGIEEWLRRVEQPIDLSSALPIARHGSPDGALFGEVLVFTGVLSMPRREAADAAASAVCEVADGVTQHTTFASCR